MAEESKTSGCLFHIALFVGVVVGLELYVALTWNQFSLDDAIWLIRVNVAILVLLLIGAAVAAKLK